MQFTDKQGVFLAVNSVFIEKETAFLREQAGLLATSLEDGNPCPVCGSTVHPSKAMLAENAPSEAVLNELKNETDLARQNMQKVSEESASKQTEVKLAQKQLLHDAEVYFKDIDRSIMQEQISVLVESALAECRQKKMENDYKYLELKELVSLKNQSKERVDLLEQSLQTNEDIATYQPLDPMLNVRDIQIKIAAYIGDGSYESPYVTPYYCNFEVLPTMTIFVGQREIFLPDCKNISR